MSIPALVCPQCLQTMATDEYLNHSQDHDVHSQGSAFPTGSQTSPVVSNKKGTPVVKLKKNGNSVKKNNNARHL